jgi:thioesterase domain-containing protein
LNRGSGMPLFCIHPAGGVSWSYQALSGRLDCPVAGIQQVFEADETEPRSIREMAEKYADRIEQIYPTGPCNLLGWSFGGMVAHELAIELQRRGRIIAALIVLDAQPGPDSRFFLPGLTFDLGAEHDDALTYEQMEELVRELSAIDISWYEEFFELLVQNLNRNIALYRIHTPRMFEGDVTIVSAVRDRADRGSYLTQSWRPYVSGNITMYEADCTHDGMLTAESVGRYIEPLRQALRRGERELRFASEIRLEARAHDTEYDGERAG